MTDDNGSSSGPRTPRRRRPGGERPTGSGKRPTGGDKKPIGGGKRPAGGGKKPTEEPITRTERNDPLDTGFPSGPEWVPKNPRGPTGPKGGPAFDLTKWDREMPMLLLPIRLETKYVDDEGDRELRIRILPDPLTVSGATPATDGELNEARDFWTDYHAAAGAPQRAATWRQFVRRLGTQRAGYVARSTRPTVAADGRITFPSVVQGKDGPSLASMLPQRWMATGWVGDAVAFQIIGKEINGPIATSPDPSAPTGEVGGTGLNIDEDTAWLFDYDIAVERGMAITVPLVDQAAIASERVSTLIVIGIDESQTPAESADELTALFEQHTRSAGLAFVPQGTPTNNADTVEAGYRREAVELEELEERELGAYQSQIDDNATRLTTALGLAEVEVFGRVAHGPDRQHERSRDMRTALFEVVLGTYVRELLSTHGLDSDVLDGGFEGETVNAIREWFVDWVCGGAPVPAIRVGNQPYSILPVMRREGTEQSTETPNAVEGSTRHHVAGVVEVLIEEWRAALAAVPVLDHNATDTVDDEAEVRDAVTAVLSNNPHPRRLVVRDAVDWSDQPRPVLNFPRQEATAQRSTSNTDPSSPFEDFEGLPSKQAPGGFRWEFDNAVETLETDYASTLKQLYDAVVQEVASGGPAGDVLIPQPTPASLVEQNPLPRDDSSIRGIEEQIKIWVETDLAIDDDRAINLEYAEIFPELHDFCDDVISQLERHELRQRPLRWLDVPDLDGVLGRRDLQLLLTKFVSSGPLWQRATVQDTTPPAGITTSTYLASLAEDLLPDSGGPTRPTDVDPGHGDLLPGEIELPGGLEVPDINALPLQFTAAAPLLYQLLAGTINRGGDRQARSEAVARLADAAPDELDWLLRETLGLGTNRLDAWHTSLATERLSTLREQQPIGLYVGAFGFVLDLNRSTERATNGFIHAPSLPHAASAAVLRSGWLARGDENAESPAAIDLSSARVRDADWLLSGVRNGQDLGDLLGVRFERGLHDAFLDVAIRPLRLAVGAADGLDALAGDSPVDGARLLDLYRDDQLDGDITALQLGAGDNAALHGLFADLEAAFDAVDDATTFESVHQLVVGNLDRAAAVVDAMGPNGGRPPELAGVRTPRNALTIDIRALVMIEAGSTSAGRGWSAGTRDRLDPELDAWVATMLPNASDVGWLGVDAAGGDIAMTLSDLEVSALDACYLASDDPRTVSAAFRRLTELAFADEPFVELRTDVGLESVTLTEFQLLAVELRRLVQEGTPADARALAGPEDTQTVDAHAGEVPQHVEDTIADLLVLFDTVATRSAWSDLEIADALALARIGLVPSANIDPSDDFATLVARLGRRRAAHDRIENPETLDGARHRVATLIGVAAPLLSPFDAPGAQGVQFDDGLAQHDDIDDWFDLVSPIRKSVANLWRGVMVGGLLGVAPPVVAAGHYPLVAGDTWAGLHRPQAGTGSRVAAAAVTHGNVDPGTSVVGIVIDQWSERIPADDQVTGVAFHYDAPSAQAPQTMLLTVVPEGQSWSTDLVIDTLLETIEWAQLRTVAIDDLGDYGHALPTTFIPGELQPLPTQGATP